VSAVRVDRSVQETNGGTAAGNGAGARERVQGIQGVVREVDARNGLFTLDVGNGSRYVVSLPYNVSRADNDRFRALRPGDQVRFYGVLLNSTRIDLRQFY
jgi:tRNA(Ile2) C34 agmatinyltransferase TiaS